MRAGDAGQHEHHRARFLCPTAEPAPAEILRAGVGFETGIIALLTTQAGDDIPGAVGVAKITEVIDLGALLKMIARPVVPTRTAVHSFGVNHQIMVGLIKQIGRQHFQAAPDPFALDIASDHRQIGIDRRIGPVQQMNQRGFRHHRFQTGQIARVSAFFNDGQQKIAQQIEYHVVKTGDFADQIEQDR